jgi:polyisoprenyl-teichoic acid--peptidoglycan teichoic acid transferase
MDSDRPPKDADDPVEPEGPAEPESDADDDVPELDPELRAELERAVSPIESYLGLTDPAPLAPPRPPAEPDQLGLGKGSLAFDEVLSEAGLEGGVEAAPPPPPPPAAEDAAAEPGTGDGRSVQGEAAADQAAVATATVAPPQPMTPAEGALPPGMILPPGVETLGADSPGDEPPTGHGLWWRFALAAFLIIGSMATATSASLLLYLTDIAEGLGEGGADLTGVQEQLQHVEGGDPQTILIIGSDRRPGDAKGLPARSDTTILLRLDPERDAISLFALPRDLRVTIPGVGTDRINVAYARGGPQLTLKTVRRLTGLKIHHLVNVNFAGFVKAVEAIDCVYLDVDRRYFNEGGNYAAINLQPGYQRLCGEEALDFVRYRHTDSDIFRGGRQHEFLREARQKIGPEKLVQDRKKMIKIFTRYTTSDIDDPETMLEVLKLFLAARNAQVQEVQFEGGLASAGGALTATATQVQKAVTQFLGIEATGGPRGRAGGRGRATRRPKKKEPKARALRVGGANVIDASGTGRQQALAAQPRLRFNVYYPTVLKSGTIFAQPPRTYTISAPGFTPYRAYKMVFKTGFGEYYGLMGTAWHDPPILKNPSEIRKFGKRTFMLYYDGDRVRMVAWRTERAAYWLTNGLLQGVSPEEMLAIARSTKFTKWRRSAGRGG